MGDLIAWESAFLLGVPICAQDWESPFLKALISSTTNEERKTVTHTILKKTKIATSLSLILGSGLLFPVHAQDAKDDVEVIQVTGIRGSVQESMGIKRDSAGVVDAISAVDIGKFPDTNLAESLQRITGISISRNNG